MHVVDPREQLEHQYQSELSELRLRMGEPRTPKERLRFEAEKRKLRRRVFGMLPPRGTASW